jgi:hypothetical protein
MSVHGYRALCAALLAVVVMLSASPASARRQKAAKKDATAEQAAGTVQPAAPAGAKVDLNTATEKELEALPGVGKATAKKIIAGRPYSSADDLSKAGISAKTIDRLKSQVTAGGTTAQPAPKVAPAPVLPAAPAQPATKRAVTTQQKPAVAAGAMPAQVPPQAGMVWVNLDSKVFHREGSHWYGRTKNGKFMAEADAVAAGYREAKTHTKKLQ